MVVLSLQFATAASAVENSVSATASLQLLWRVPSLQFATAATAVESSWLRAHLKYFFLFLFIYLLLVLCIAER